MKNDDEIRTEHPSYGLLTIHRVSGGERVLFASPIMHNEKIELRVYNAQLVRDTHLHYDRYFQNGRVPIVEIEMSPAQFAEAITSLNRGEGTPCTIRYTDSRGPTEPCPFIDKRVEIENEFNQQMQEKARQLSADVKLAHELLANKKSLNKEDRGNLMAAFANVQRFFSDSMPFVHKQFTEAMEKTATAAKAEIFAYATSTLGVDANVLTDQAERPLLENKSQ